jgi:predicted ATP-grasp superfamily ATP-dependent carboligase
LAAYDELSDKARLVEHAARLNIRTPETFVVSDMEAARTAIARVGLPIVIKPARSRYRHGGRIHSTSVSIAASAGIAEASLLSSDWFGRIPALIQRYVPGTGAGLFALFHSGNPVAWFAHRRLREKPPSGGVSVLSESAVLDRQLVAVATRLLSSVGWSGVAMLEFKVSTDGIPYLMEVNGRFWGSLQLAIDCGVDFPWLLYQSALGKLPDGRFDYVAGRRLHWTLGDLDSLLISLRQPSARISSAARVRIVGEFLRTCISPAARSEVMRWSDPVPGLYEAREWARHAFRAAHAAVFERLQDRSFTRSP